MGAQWRPSLKLLKRLLERLVAAINCESLPVSGDPCWTSLADEQWPVIGLLAHLCEMDARHGGDSPGDLLEVLGLLSGKLLNRRPWLAVVRRRNEVLIRPAPNEQMNTCLLIDDAIAKCVPVPWLLTLRQLNKHNTGKQMLAYYRITLSIGSLLTSETTETQRRRSRWHCRQ